jgi:hypothetical protein
MSLNSRHTLLYTVTGFSVITSFIFVGWVLAFHEIPEKNRELFIHLMGIIEGAFVGGLVATFFGSSKKEHDPMPEKTEQP